MLLNCFLLSFYQYLYKVKNQSKLYWFLAFLRFVSLFSIFLLLINPIISRKINEIKKAPIVIGNDVWIGTRAIIFKGTVIGDRVIVGAASLLSGLEVPEDKKVVGNPGVIK
jgi:acetyltransferase-like isoleucine patch superfamily enzyme